MGFERLDDACSMPLAWATILEEGLNSLVMAEDPSRAKDLS